MPLLHAFHFSYRERILTVLFHAHQVYYQSAQEGNHDTKAN